MHTVAAIRFAPRKAVRGNRGLIAPTSAKCQTGNILRLFELLGEIALVIETAQLRDFFHRLVRKPQQSLCIIDAQTDDMLENRFAVSTLEFACQVVFADIESTGQVIQ